MDGEWIVQNHRFWYDARSSMMMNFFFFCRVGGIGIGSTYELFSEGPSKLFISRDFDRSILDDDGRWRRDSEDGVIGGGW